jgi:hypothetical protein
MSTAAAAPQLRSVPSSSTAEAGVTRVEAVACDDGTWVVEGRDIGCRDREAEIAPRTARLLDIERT